MAVFRRSSRAKVTADTTNANISSAKVDSTIEDLRARLEDLPQEIFDMIHTEVFTAAPGLREIMGLHDINGRKKHRAALKMMHVSQKTRQLYWKTYYGPGAHFIFPFPAISSPFDYGFWIWNSSLPGQDPGLKIDAQVTYMPIPEDDLNCDRWWSQLRLDGHFFDFRKSSPALPKHLPPNLLYLHDLKPDEVEEWKQLGSSRSRILAWWRKKQD